MERPEDFGNSRRRDLKSWLSVLMMMAVAFAAISPGALSPRMAAADNPLPGRFPAPSLEGGVEWLNTTGEISLKDLRGKIVILDFWTYCCINCMHILPDLKYLEQKYPNQIVVIGVHAAKFDNEKETENIRKAILRYDIEHPVVNDANMVIARKYHFQSWPTMVLIDPEGNYVGQQAGEGNRELFDQVIPKLIAFHRAKGTLDETPVRFVLERASVAPTPLRFPGKLLVDAPNDRLFVSDSNHNRIVVSTLAGKLVDVIGNGNLGADDGDYQTATFDHPQGMTLVGDHLYVADTENHLIRMVDLKERKVTRAAGTGKQAREYLSGGPTRTTALNSPWALTHLDDTLFIAMAGPHQLWSHKLGSGRLNVFAGNGREDIIDGPRENASLAQPSGLTNDGKSLYFVDSEGSAVRSVGLDKTGTVTTIAGTHDLPSGRSLFEFGDVDGTGDAARLQHPLGVLYHDGGLFVADSYNHKIKLVDPATRKCTTWLGTGKPGTGLSPVELSEPADVAIIDNKMIIADTNNHRLLRVDLQTKQAEEFVIEGLEPPPPPTFDSSADDDEPIVKLEPQSVRPGDELTIELATELPEGFKLNPLAPQTCRLGSEEKQSLVAEDNLNVKLEGVSDGHTVRWSVPLVEKSGSATFELKVSYSYCRDGTGGVCRFGTARWEVPVRVAPDATASAVSLKVSPPK